MDMAEPSSIPELAKLQLDDLDVVHSNLDVSWFDIDDHEFGGYFLKPPVTSSEKENSLSPAAEATVALSSIAESINPGYVNEFEGATSAVYNTPLEDNIADDHIKTVVEGLNLQTLDVIECSEGNNNLDYDYREGSTSPVMSEGKSGVKLTSENLVRLRGHGVDALRGWRALKILLPASLFVLFIVLICVDILIQDERDMLPPPT